MSATTEEAKRCADMASGRNRPERSASPGPRPSGQGSGRHIRPGGLSCSLMRLLALLVALASSVAAASGPDLSAFASLPADPAPPELVRGLHYWISNENDLALFHDA